MSPAFLWGAGSSAHQTEGGNRNNWTEWEKLGRVANGEESGRAADHYHRYGEDFALAKKLGHNAHRFSIEWSRIEPEPGVIDEAAIEHYSQVIAELRRLEIEPMVTLYHYTLPVWAAKQGGWLNRKTVDDFGRFVMTAVRALGSDVTYWVTVNEPTVLTTFSYIGGLWPPQEKNWVHAWRAFHHLLAAHRLAYQIIHRDNPEAKVGVANSINHIVPARRGNLLDRGLVVFSSYWHNQWWLDHTYQTQDFIGVNYYFQQPLQFQFTGVKQLFAPTIPPEAPVSDLGWWISPSGLADALHWLRRYHRPIIITENGLADAMDTRRADFIRHHTDVIRDAIRDGADIRGYFHWSLTDNFEWAYGFAPRFGLVAIDYPTQTRTVRPSAEVYRDIIQAHKKHSS